MLNKLFAVANKFEKKLAQVSLEQKRAPESLSWNKDQILNLQKLMNKAIKAWTPTIPLLQEDGVYGPKTREQLDVTMHALGVMDPAQVVTTYQQKFQGQV